MKQYSLIFFVIAICAGALHAAGPVPTGATFHGALEVNLVNLQVVVTRRGAPVTDLTAADFTVLEDGEPREISHFQVVVDGVDRFNRGAVLEAAGTVADDAQPLDPSLLVLAFDTSSIPNQQLRRALQAARESVRASARPDLHWAVVLLGSRPHWLLAPTNDVDRVRDVLDGVESGQVRVDSALFITERALDTGSRASDETGPPRRNALIEDMACELGRRERNARNMIHGNALADVFQAHGATYRSKALVLMYGANAELEFCGGNVVHPSMGMMEVADLYELWRDVAREAATAGFRVYASDAHGLVNPAAGMGPAPHRLFNKTAFAVANSDLAKVVATETGGEEFESNDLGMSLEAATRDVLTYYSIAFRAPRRHDGEPHRVRVEVARSGVRVRHAREMFDLDPRVRLARQLTIPAGFVTSPGKLHFQVEVEDLERPDSKKTASAVLPLASLTLLPDGQTMSASVEALVAIHDASGEVVALEGSEHRLTVPVDDPALGESDTEVVLDVPFDEPQGAYTLSMAVLDMVSRDSGLAYTTVSPSKNW